MPTKLSAQETKDMLLATAKEMISNNLVEGTAGNLSARLPDGNVVVTPGSLPYETMTLDDLVVCDLDGNVLEGTRSPTSEKDLHLNCLRDHLDINAVMHCHAKYSTMFAITNTPIPCVIEEVHAYIGGDVLVADYKMTGSKELGAEVSRATHRWQEPSRLSQAGVARRTNGRDRVGRAFARRARATA